ncbi:uncharacterized protein [Watersipora subatra]|uniref:uncharacterized protein n=1 Tax=Watersipora subatra TaxID=2589382 RepID=UPI00355B5E2F
MLISADSNLLVFLAVILASVHCLPLDKDEIVDKLDNPDGENILRDLEKQSRLGTPGQRYWDYLMDSLPLIKQYLKDVDDCVEIVDKLQTPQESSSEEKGSNSDLEEYQQALCPLTIELFKQWENGDLDITEFMNMLGYLTNEDRGEAQELDSYLLKAGIEQQNQKRAYDSIGLGPFGLRGVSETRNFRNAHTKKVYDSIGMGPMGLKRTYDPIGMGPMGLKRTYDPIGIGPMGLKRTYDTIGMGPMGLKRTYDPIGIGPMGLKRAYDTIGVGPMGLKRSYASDKNQESQQQPSASQEDLLKKLAKALTTEGEEIKIA